MLVTHGQTSNEIKISAFNNVVTHKFENTAASRMTLFMTGELFVLNIEALQVQNSPVNISNYKIEKQWCM